MENNTSTKKQEKSPRYSGSYNRLFPVKVSTNTFITIYALHLLKDNNKLYGKEMINKIEERFSGNWKPSHGLVYPILRELEEEGLVVGEWLGDNNKKTIRQYSITNKGRKVYETEKEKHKQVFAQSYSIMETLMSDLYDEYTELDIDWDDLDFDIED